MPDSERELAPEPDQIQSQINSRNFLSFTFIVHIA